MLFSPSLGALLAILFPFHVAFLFGGFVGIEAREFRVGFGTLAKHVHVGERFFGSVDVLRSRLLEPEQRLLVTNTELGVPRKSKLRARSAKL
jgi:hypothetical protein